MNATELAAILNGREYTNEITEQEEAEAKAAGLVVVFGASDDLMEFRGAIDDLIGANDGTTVSITAAGILPSWDSINHDDEESCAAYFKQKDGVVRDIDAIWCGEVGYSWTYKTDIPHATFEITEDGGPYCRGIVFSMADL